MPELTKKEIEQKDFVIVKDRKTQAISKIVGYSGIIEWDANKPDGTPRKLLDSQRIRSFGWRPTVSFEEGLKSTYQWYVESLSNSERSL
jgi:GDP-L-fucose synthase